jgi:hypothetical protein
LFIVTISVHLCDLWFPFSCRRLNDGARVGKGSLEPQITQMHADGLNAVAAVLGTDLEK